MEAIFNEITIPITPGTQFPCVRVTRCHRPGHSDTYETTYWFSDSEWDWTGKGSSDYDTTMIDLQQEGMSPELAHALLTRLNKGEGKTF